MSTTEFLQRANALTASGPAATGFQRRGSLCESPHETATVSRAVASAKGGDRDALRYLYIRYADHVYGYVSTIVRDSHEAEDVTQHVFAKLITALPKYEEQRAPFAAWMLRVARNVAVDHLRQLRAIPCEEVRPDSDEEATEHDGRQRTLVLQAALASLPKDQREVLVLRHLVGLTPPEIARRLGRSESSVHGLHHRGRGALRSVLDQMGEAPATLAAAA